VSKKADWEPEELSYTKPLVEASNSFPLALRISLLAAALLAALVWILRLLARRRRAVCGLGINAFVAYDLDRPICFRSPHL
jgi:hypothetical protein